MVSASRSILLEVLAHVPIDFAQCLHCEYLSGLAQVGLPVHREIQHSYPPEVLEEAGRLVAWLQKIVERHGKNLRVHVISHNRLRDSSSHSSMVSGDILRSS